MDLQTRYLRCLSAARLWLIDVPRLPVGDPSLAAHWELARIIAGKGWDYHSSRLEHELMSLARWQAVLQIEEIWYQNASAKVRAHHGPTLGWECKMLMKKRAHAAEKLNKARKTVEELEGRCIALISAAPVIVTHASETVKP